MTEPFTTQQISVRRAGPGTVVGGRYTLRAAVGTGGMGTVWHATDTQLNRDVAVKEVVPPAGIAPDDRDAMYERMMREARAAAGLSHPGIVQVYDVVTDSGRPWVVMELLDARSLADMVLEDGPLAPRAVAKIGVAMLGALEVAHAAGVLHRDVKPANVLVCTDGRCVLTDFGVARMPTDQQLTTPGMVLGSPHFISPERAMGAPFGPPSDLFSLGVTLYAAVEGRPPFDKGEPIATMHAVVEDEPMPPQRAGALTEVLYGLLEKDPSRRWDTARARQMLRDLLAGPLASKTPMFPTDPYAVVQTQQLPHAVNGGERVGGRAMLSPGELPTDRIDPYQATPDQYAQPLEPDTVVTPAVNGDHGPPGWPEPAAGEGTAQQARTLASRAGSRVVAAGSWVVDAVRRAPGGVQVAAAAALTAIVLIGVVMAIGSRGDDPGQGAGLPTAPAPSAEPSGGPAFDVETYTGRGIEVNLPEQWRGNDNSNLVYVDYVDPANASVGVRLLAEPWSGQAPGLVEAAEENIQNNPNCASYQRVSITDVEMAGRSGAQLEYTCGEGDELRRARWVTVVEDGTAYSFRFTAPEAEFAERQAIFDELLRSFRLTG